MPNRIAQRLAELGLELPAPHAPPANFVGAVAAGGLLHISGQGPVADGKIAVQGKVPTDHDLDAARQAARLTALNILAQAQAALDGDLDRVVRVVKLFGLVNCTPELPRPALIIDAASQLLIDVFGSDIGPHARTAMSAPSLPFGITVEIDAVFQIRDPSPVNAAT